MRMVRIMAAIIFAAVIGFAAVKKSIATELGILGRDQYVVGSGIGRF